MGIISLYGKLLSSTAVKQPVVPKYPEEIYEGYPLLEDAVDITLAEFDRNTKDVITAHRLQDYRRKRFNLVLLPQVDIMFDRLLEGSEYWDALLHYEGTKS